MVDNDLPDGAPTSAEAIGEGRPSTPSDAEFRRLLKASRTPERRRRDIEIATALEKLRT